MIPALLINEVAGLLLEGRAASVFKPYCPSDWRRLCSANADKELKKKLGSAERILKLGELCRKLETEQEKVLPFCSPEQALGLQPLADQEGSQQVEGEASANGLEDSDHQVWGPTLACPTTSPA